MLPQVGQGALAVECRADDDDTRARVAAIDDRGVHAAVDAERALPRRARRRVRPAVRRARAHASTATTSSIEALLAAVDGHVVLRATARDRDPVVAGRARRAPSSWTRGGRSLLEDARCDTAARMTVYLVGAGPGDPGLLTVRGAELLRRADVVVYDRLASSALLALAPDGAELIAAGKAPGDVDLTQDEINQLLVDQGRTAECVVRLKGGDPFVFGRGGEEAEALAAAGIPFEVVPGITSAIGAAAYAGIPVTHRGVSTHFTVVTGHEDPTKDTHRRRLGRAGPRRRHARDPHGRGPHRRDRPPPDRGRARARHAGRRGAQRHPPRSDDGAGHAGHHRRRRGEGTERDRRRRRRRRSTSRGSRPARCSAARWWSPGPANR